MDIPCTLNSPTCNWLFFIQIGFILTVLLSLAVLLTIITDKIPSTSIEVSFLCEWLDISFISGVLSIKNVFAHKNWCNLVKIDLKPCTSLLYLQCTYNVISIFVFTAVYLLITFALFLNSISLFRAVYYAFTFALYLISISLFRAMYFAITSTMYLNSFSLFTTMYLVITFTMYLPQRCPNKTEL